MARRARPISAEDSPRHLAHNPQKLRSRAAQGRPDAVEATQRKEPGFEVPASGARADDVLSVLSFEESEVDLTNNALAEASLFDRPARGAGEGADERDELEEQSVDELTLEAPLREPRITSDDPSEVDERKRRAIQRALDERVKKRLRVAALPKELGKPLQKHRTA